MDERQLAHVRSWARGNSEISHVSGTVYYMFSGPDFLYARTFFPNASTYILCGTEPVGSVPDITKMPPANVSSDVSNVRHALDTMLTTHYFITKDMRVDLTRGYIGGTLPLLYVFLEKSGCFINSVSFSGPSVQIDFHSPSGKSQTLYYFKTDLSNGGGNGSFLAFCKRQGARRQPCSSRRAISCTKRASPPSATSSSQTARSSSRTTPASPIAPSTSVAGM